VSICYFLRPMFMPLLTARGDVSVRCVVGSFVEAASNTYSRLDGFLGTGRVARRCSAGVLHTRSVHAGAPPFRGYFALTFQGVFPVMSFRRELRGGVAPQPAQVVTRAVAAAELTIAACVAIARDAVRSRSGRCARQQGRQASRRWQQRPRRRGTPRRCAVRSGSP
jgi:hypothetical protein